MRRRVLLRVIQGGEGEVEFHAEYAPRPEYGLIYPILEAAGGCLWARRWRERARALGRIDVDHRG